jgi:hypothetical protein
MNLPALRKTTFAGLPEMTFRTILRLKAGGDWGREVALAGFLHTFYLAVFLTRAKLETLPREKTKD